MSVVTKAGDRGITSLYCGTKVSKDDVRIEACGSLDEVSSFLGMAKSMSDNAKTKRVVALIQKQLPMLCTEIVTAPGAKKLKRTICNRCVSGLEDIIDDLEKNCGIRTKCFSTPGANEVSGALDVARAITRRAERRCVTMLNKRLIENDCIIVYLNRLSDLLYLLARFNEKAK